MADTLNNREIATITEVADLYSHVNLKKLLSEVDVYLFENPGCKAYDAAHRICARMERDHRDPGTG